jgi:hypothetical protein
MLFLIDVVLRDRSAIFSPSHIEPMKDKQADGRSIFSSLAFDTPDSGVHFSENDELLVATTSDNRCNVVHPRTAYVSAT